MRPAMAGAAGWQLNCCEVNLIGNEANKTLQACLYSASAWAILFAKENAIDCVCVHRRAVCHSRGSGCWQRSAAAVSAGGRHLGRKRSSAVHTSSTHRLGVLAPTLRDMHIGVLSPGIIAGTACGVRLLWVVRQAIGALVQGAGSAAGATRRLASPLCASRPDRARTRRKPT